MKRARTPFASLFGNDDSRFEEEEADEEEEDEPMTNSLDGEEMPIDAPVHKVSSLSILNSIPIQEPPKVTKGNAATAAADEVPTVSLNSLYYRTYNESMQNRFVCSSSSSSSSSEESGEEEAHSESDAHLFDSLFPPNTGSPASSDSSPKKKNKKEKAKNAKKNKRLSPGPLEFGRRPECFLCGWGNRFHDGLKAKDIAKFFDIMKNYGVCGNEELAQQLSLYYEKHVYKKNCGMSKFPQEMALDHIEGLHSLAAEIYVGESIRLWKKVQWVAQRHLYKANGKVNRDQAQLLHQATRNLKELYKDPIQKLNFACGKSSEDLRHMGLYFTIMPEFKQKKESRKRAKKKQKRLALNEQSGFDI